MIKFIFLCVSIIAFVLVIIYSWVNRDSDRVLLALSTAMSIGVLGFITNEALSNKTEKFAKEFPVVVFFSLPDYRPLNIRLPYWYDLATCMQEIAPTDIPKKNHVDFDFAQDIYFDALQYSVIKSIFEKFAVSWNTKTKHIHTPSGDALSWQYIKEDGKEILIADILSKMPNNYFVKNGLFKNLSEPLGDRAIFPPDTEFEIQIKEGGRETLIVLSNRYISMNIRISKLSSSVGIGEYSRMFGQETNTHTGNSVYLLEVSAEQNFWLNGHPEMEKYRHWTDSIAEHLNNKFNYEVINEEHRRQFQLFGPRAVLYN